MKGQSTACAGVALAVTLAAGAAVEAETVSLAFAWPAGVSATVDFSAQRRRERGQHNVARGVDGTYQMTTTRVDDGLRVAFADFDLTVSDTTGQEAQGKLHELLSRLAATLPDYVVGPAGQIVRIEGAEAMRDELLGAVNDLGTELPEQLRGRMEQVVRSALTTEQLEASLRTTWEQDVGAWIGLELETGRAYDRQAVVSSPVLGGATVPMAVTYRLVERAPCTASATQRECVVIEMESQVNDAGAAGAVAALSRRLSSQAGREVRIERVGIRNRLRLLTEPGTLLPHEVRVTRTTELQLAGAAQTDRQSEERVTRYTYR